MTMLAKKLTKTLSSLLLAGLTICGLNNTCIAQGFTLYTPFTEISVPPSESINYPIEVINKGKSVQTGDIALTGLPKEWTYELKSGGWRISQLSVLPGDKKDIALQV